MIINLQQNKFLKAENFTGLNGIWVYGEGVVFNTEEDANTYYRNNCTGNEVLPVMKNIVIDGKVYFQKNSTNVFD